MGLGKVKEKKTVFVTIAGGKFVVRGEGPGAVTRVLEQGPNAGEEISEFRYDSIDGNIVDAGFEDSEYGERFYLCLKDNEMGEVYKLRIPVNSSFFGQIVKRLPNLNGIDTIYLGIGYDREKERSFIFMRQNSENVPFAFTKADPNGMPDAGSKVVRGKETWDFTEQDNFLYEVAQEFIETFNEFSMSDVN